MAAKSSIVQRLASALTPSTPKAPDPADVAKLRELRAQMALVEGPPNRRDLLQMIEVALAHNAEAFERDHLREAIEAFRPSMQQTLSPRDRDAQDFALLQLLLHDFGHSPIAALCYVLAPQLLAGFKARLQRFEYHGCDSPSLSERPARREQLHREIVALERATGVHERRALESTSSVAKVFNRSAPK